MVDDTPFTTTTTTTLLLCPNQWWFNSLRLKTTLSAELRGSVGDLGTYIPIILALTLVNHLDLSTTLIFTALYNISTGFLFGTPMPVQPMKSIAAVAISNPFLSLPQIVIAGLSTAATLFILGAISLMSPSTSSSPSPSSTTSSSPKASPLPFPNWLGLDGIALALFSMLFLVLAISSGDFGNEAIPLGVHEEENDSVNRFCRRVRWTLQIMSSIPAALIVFILGLVLCFIRDPSIVKDLQFGPSRIHLWEDWKIWFFL
ncbi:hypothetical protein PVL29_009090 [Vitis rotundifolia]|uniref:Uncharacterized protein n=1 Tax=Vitis rotundifolia TaxID=103349 RepID=A0AA39DVL7_VITRO|nr:hypothetical protein PVL29_009090 [Vitis rotundifolia]